MVEVDAFKVGDTAGKLIVGVQDDRRAEKAALREAAAETPEMRLAAQAHAKRLAIREQFLLNLWRPLAKWAGVSREYFERDFPRELAAKLEQVPEGELQTPRAAIVAPAMEALGYSLDEPALKDMYLNLLAGASTRTKASEVHPSFVDTVRHLSTDEAPILDLVLRIDVWALAGVKREYSRDMSYDVITPYVLDLVDSLTQAPKVFPHLAGWINNWQRLGLVDATFEEHRVSREGLDLYAWVLNRPEWKDAKALEPVLQEGEQPESSIEIRKGILRATARGNAFFKVVSSPV